METSSKLSLLEKEERYNLIKNRLKYGLNKSENYSDQRVTNLVSVLNTYDNFIDSFDSIELDHNSNCLDKDVYLINPELHNLLVTDYNNLNRSSSKKGRDIKKDSSGIYMVVFKLLNEKENILIYNYIKYPSAFKDCFINYIFNESSSLIIHNSNNIGIDYLFLLDNSFDYDQTIKFNLDKITEKLRLIQKYGNTRGIFPRNVMDLYKILLQGCPILTSMDGMCHFIKLSVKKRYYEIGLSLLKIYNLYNKDSTGLGLLKDKLSNSSLKRYNLLNRSVFIVQDLNLLLEKLEKSYTINQGPQKWRGQSNSLNNVISVIDNDFRKSLNRHNQYHVNEGTIGRNHLIGRSKFSYQNIHLNIGNVRWYSSKRLISQKPKMVRDSSNIYNQLSQSIKSLPINEETPLKIEEFLGEYYNLSLKDKKGGSNKSIINYELISGQFIKLLQNEESKLLDYINRAQKVSFNDVPK